MCICVYECKYAFTCDMCMCICIHMFMLLGMAGPTWGVIFEGSRLKVRTSLLPCFGEKGRSNFELCTL